jgi:calcium/proton exchanger cax
MVQVSSLLNHVVEDCHRLIFLTDTINHNNITALSRGTAILLLLVYAAYLFFQLKSHAKIYNAPSQKAKKRRIKVEDGDATKRLAIMGAGMSVIMGGAIAHEDSYKEPDDKEEPQLSIWIAVFTLGTSTALVAICAEYMVNSINALCTPTSGLSKTFVGLILLPIVGNAAEHATAVTVACKDKMVCGSPQITGKKTLIRFDIGSRYRCSCGLEHADCLAGYTTHRSAWLDSGHREHEPCL